MAIRAITKMGHPVLRQPARELTRDELLSPAVQQLIDDMVDTMRDAEGVGLAAPQVYEDVRLFVAEVRSSRPGTPDEHALPLLVLANPEVIQASEELEHGWEGCLSIPDIKGLVPRHRTVTVRAIDRNGRAVTLEAQGYFARIFQHEMDHLDGVLYLDRMDDLTTLAYSQEFERYWLEGDEEEEDEEEL